jgi:acyl carrier protein
VNEPTSPSPDRRAPADITRMILDAIADVAPDLEPELADLDHDVDFWAELQLDSMDHLAVMTRLAEQTRREIPERDYPRLTTLDALGAYLSTDGS